MYGIGTYKGLIKTYERPFTPTNHDALADSDYVMVRYAGNEVVPVN
jgi:branched-chain amino acid transport system substrate-binding protein